MGTKVRFRALAVLLKFKAQSSKLKPEFSGMSLKTWGGGLKGVLLGGENKEVAGEGLVR
jgi:hypothetical protein